MNRTKEDDGSLAFLNIQPDPSNKHFNCPETTQQKLINLSFWVVDYIDDIKTKFGNNAGGIQTGNLPMVGMGKVLR